MQHKISYQIPFVLVLDEDGHYYPKEGGGYCRYILQSEFNSVIDDLNNHYMQLDEDEFKALNDESTLGGAI